MAAAPSRSVSRVVDAVRTIEGEGFVVRRAFPTRDLSDVDPFLLLDHFGPVEYGPGEAKGAPDHPHRGFETVTYILEGRLEHKDSVGNSGLLGPGDVQWMTAGAAVVHSEMPAVEILERGGRVHGFQLWVNLPAREKMMPPRYQDIPSTSIPSVQDPEQSLAVRVIAGEALGAQAVIDTRTPIIYLHYTLEPGAEVVQPVPPEYNVFVYVIDGAGVFGSSQQPAREGQIALFDNDGDQVSMAVPAGSAPLNVLLIGGVPLNEPIARYGPFVMNTEVEIRQAIDDYRAGRMGQILR